VILKESSLVSVGNERDHSANQVFITMAGTQLSSQSEIINRHVLSQVHTETPHGVREGEKNDSEGRKTGQTHRQHLLRPQTKIFFNCQEPHNI